MAIVRFAYKQCRSAHKVIRTAIKMLISLITYFTTRMCLFWFGKCIAKPYLNRLPACCYSKIKSSSMARWRIWLQTVYRNPQKNVGPISGTVRFVISLSINGKILLQVRDYEVIKTVRVWPLSDFLTVTAVLSEKKTRMANWRPYQNTLRSPVVKPAFCYCSI